NGNESCGKGTVLNLDHPSPNLASRTCYADTPGVNSFDEQHDDITYGYLPLADVAVIVLDGTKGEVPQSVLVFLADRLLQSEISKLIFALNKVDTVPPGRRSDLRDKVTETL